MDVLIKKNDVSGKVWFCFLSTDEEINILYPCHNLGRKFHYYKLHLN